MSENGQNFIAGAWCDGQGTIANINPSDLSDQIGHYAQADSAQLDSALDAARTAQKKWAATGLEARQTILMNIGNELMERRVELGTLLSREEGKPLAEGVGEIYRAGQFFT
jgi:acyl-CoA reductase-like NAD-dependent aldehyde dehydrogenase